MDSALTESEEQLASRAGYRLLAVRAVGIPIWQMPVLCRVQERKEVPVLHEFHLRCVNGGIKDVESIAQLLNLPIEVSRFSMGELYNDDKIMFDKRDGEKYLYRLTPAGTQLLESWEDIISVEKVTTFQWDSMLGEPTVYPREILRTARQCDAQGIFRIPSPSDGPPELGPERTGDFRAAFSTLRRDLNSSLVSIVRSEGAYETKYLAATGFLFESTDSAQELHLRVAVDGRASESHETAALTVNLLGDLKVSAHLAESRGQVDNFLGSELAGERISDVQSASIVNDLEETAASPEIPGDEVDPDSETALANRADNTQDRLSRIPVRRVGVREQSGIWPVAIRSASRRLLVMSDELNLDYWESNVEPMLIERLERGIHATVGYRRLAPSSSNDDVSARLRALRTKYERFTASRLTPNGPNVVIFDDVAVVTKLPLLSDGRYSGQRLSDDRGTLVRGPERVSDLADRLTGLFGKGVTS